MRTPQVHEQSIARYLANLPLKNKILFSSLAVIILVSISIALVARYILISSLTNELESRGLGIGHSIADRSPSLILTNDRANLTSLVFEAADVGERKDLVAYIFILDKSYKVLAHSFMHPFPDELRTANVLLPDTESCVVQSWVNGAPAYDIAVPVKEGIYDIGSVHVGLSKKHIDSIIAKLRMAFFGFITVIITIMFFISNKLSRSITRPMNELMQMSDEISRDNLNLNMDFLDRQGCWDVTGCNNQDCPAYKTQDVPCWHVEGTRCPSCSSKRFPDKLEACKECDVFKQGVGDEVVQLADSFKSMVRHVKQYRDQLKRSQQKYRSLFHSGPDPIFVLDCGTNIVLDANPTAAEVYGYSRKELVGMNFASLGPDFAAASSRTFNPEDESSLAGCVFIPKSLNYKKGNEPFYVNIHACGTIYEESPAIIVSTNDITDMIEKDAQLIQASKMKSLGEMSAGIAHEVNQPLNAIKLGSEYLSMVVEEGRDIPRQQICHVVRSISEQVDRAAEIIATMREFGRKSDMTREKLNINAPVRGVLNILGQQFILENVDLQLDLGQDLPSILAQKNRLEQVLFNLMTNARDALNMRDGDDEPKGQRQVKIRTYAQNGTVFCSVSDTGMGIDPTSLDKIFEPFFTTKATGKGMGLGLAISYGIVKDYHGEIQVESTPGAGTVFTLTFPAA
ncbi:MAG: ATP-binding protein [Desulfovibrionaceae bacterium]